MKRTVKKLAAVGLALTSVMGLVACGSTAKNNEGDSSKKETTKPTDVINVMVNGTVVTEPNGGVAFRDQLAKATGLNLKWTQPDHSGYADSVAAAFNSDDTMPDVVILSQDQYTSFASQGLLWDMTDAWKNSDTKKSGRLVDTADSVMDSLLAAGDDGKQALYGFTTTRGNGCVTYVKEDWLKKANIDPASVKDKTLTFNEYYDILKKMHDATGKSVISAPGYVNEKEAPYTNYLPEFYQQAQFTFYKDSSGKYVDGFTTQAMKDAMTRIATAVKDGIIDKESVNNSTANARDKFYADNSGVFTYWAGKWADTIRQNLATKNLNENCIELKPIKELGAYVERVPATWSITKQAKNPEGIFKYFLDTMLDGGEIQTLWTYGAKGVHWDDKAETVTLQGKEDKPSTYTEGQFHFLPSPEKPTTLMQANNIDPLLALAKYTKADPGDSQIAPLAKVSEDFFVKNSKVATVPLMTEAMGDNIGDINTQRKNIIAKVASGELTADQGVAEYTKNVGSMVDKVLESLNKK